MDIFYMGIRAVSTTAIRFELNSIHRRSETVWKLRKCGLIIFRREPYTRAERREERIGASRVCETQIPSIRMFTDNPSYFSLSGGTSSSTKTTTTTTTLTSPTSPRGHSSFSALFRRRACSKMGAASSQGGVVVSESTSSVHHENRGNVSGASTPEERVPMLSRNGAIQPGKRRSFRNLFRSVSANAEHERTQKFLKGDPRPSDVAPPSPYLPHR